MTPEQAARSGAATIGICKVCEAAGFEKSACAYCSAPLSPRHEHDHMPYPARHGGEEVVPVCLNCHDLKDRVSLLDWQADTFLEAFAGATPMGRILVVKAITHCLDLAANLPEAE